MKIDCFGASRIGARRQQNQDSWFCNSERGVLLVCDGMGAHIGGAMASSIAKRELESYSMDRESDDLETGMAEALAVANQSIAQAGLAEPLFSTMGTTATFGIVEEDNLYLAHAGDSRAYKLSRRGKFQCFKERLVQLTTDHTLGAAINAAPHSTLHNKLTIHLGRNFESWDELVKVHRLKTEDRLLFLTDGVIKVLSDEELERILKEASSPQDVVERIMAKLEQDAGDDHSVVVGFVT